MCKWSLRLFTGVDIFFRNYHGRSPVAWDDSMLADSEETRRKVNMQDRNLFKMQNDSWIIHNLTQFLI